MVIHSCFYEPVWERQPCLLHSEQHQLWCQQEGPSGMELPEKGRPITAPWPQPGDIERMNFIAFSLREMRKETKRVWPITRQHDNVIFLAHNLPGSHRVTTFLANNTVSPHCSHSVDVGTTSVDVSTNIALAKHCKLNVVTTLSFPQWKKGQKNIMRCRFWPITRQYNDVMPSVSTGKKNLAKGQWHYSIVERYTSQMSPAWKCRCR